MTGGTQEEIKEAFITGFKIGAGIGALRCFVVGAKIITLARFLVLSATANFIFNATVAIYAIVEGCPELAITYAVLAVLSIAEWCWANHCCANVEVFGDKGSTNFDIAPDESKTVEVKLPRDKYPESAKHIEEAINEGQPETLTIDRKGAVSRRKASLKGIDTVPGLDRDEYPPAMSNEGGAGASVKLINPSDNRGSGSYISSQLRKYPDGTKYRIIIIDED